MWGYAGSRSELGRAKTSRTLGIVWEALLNLFISKEAQNPLYITLQE